MIRRWLYRLLFRLLDDSMKIQYADIDKKTVDDWLLISYKEKGFENYFKLEDLKILKALGIGQERDQYMILVGRRIQLLYMYDDMRKSFELKDKNK